MAPLDASRPGLENELRPILHEEIDRLPRERGIELAWDNVIYDSPALGYVVATYHRGIADLQFVSDVEASRDLAGDDRLLRLNEAVPASRGGQIEPALQITVTMHLAGDHEMPGAADITDEHGFGADKCRGR